jgi:CRP-like cAMP-binding protein
MVSSASASATAGGHARRAQIFNSSDTFTPGKALTVHAKSEKSRDFLLGALTMHYLFESLGAEDLERIIECMRPFGAKAGETVIREGDIGDLFYCLEVGTAAASVKGQGTVFSYTSGGCFGELALIYNSPRAASVVATSNCEFWVLDLRFEFHYCFCDTFSEV